MFRWLLKLLNKNNIEGQALVYIDDGSGNKAIGRGYDIGLKYQPEYSDETLIREKADIIFRMQTNNIKDIILKFKSNTKIKITFKTGVGEETLTLWKCSIKKINRLYPLYVEAEVYEIEADVVQDAREPTGQYIVMGDIQP